MFAILLSDAMDPFYQNISSFPTVFFTFFLLLSVFYWLVAVLGLIDIEFLDFDMPEGDLDPGLNADSAHSVADALTGVLLKFGLNGVPLTVVISFVSLFGWLISYYLVHYLFSWLDPGWLRYLAGIPILLLALYAAVMITALAIRPLRPLFRQQNAVKHILGQTAIVRSSRVDNNFGEAFLQDGGAGLILKVRSTGNDVFSKGDRVVLFEHRPEENIYRVVSEQEFKG
ncbi:MAG: DUF1449 domain-containing protein [gamma proteobacterium symbiont of Bathyaustriella thionipta]|nr:DUF1449 domain-containing protein [gamma proteobacterium symbiont of Bathyaustriella thionipta]